MIQCKANIIHDLHLRQLGFSNSRSLGRRIIRHLLVGVTPLTHVLSQHFSRRGITIHDQIICAKSFSSNNGIKVYRLWPNVCHGKPQLRHIFTVPHSQRRLQADTIMIHESSYLYREDVPTNDYAPALLVLLKNCLWRYHCTTFKLMSQHDLSFTSHNMVRFDIDYNNDWLIIKSVLHQHEQPDAASVTEAVFVVFDLHPYRHRCTFVVSGAHFPSGLDTQLYGAVTSIDFYGSFLMLVTSHKYSLFYDMQQYITAASGGQETTHMIPGQLLLAAPGDSNRVSLDEQSGHYTLLYGDSCSAMRLTSVETVIEYMSQRREVLSDRNRNGGNTPRSRKRNSSGGGSESDTGATACEVGAAGGLGNTEHDTPPHRGVEQERHHMVVACGEPVQWQGEMVGHEIDYSVDFFPGYFNRLVMSLPSEIRVSQLPLRQDVDRHAPLLGAQVFRCVAATREPPLPTPHVTRSGRRVQQTAPYTHEDDHYLTMLCSDDYNVFFVLTAKEEDNTDPGLSILLHLRIYDIFSCKFLREIELNCPVQVDPVLAANRIEMYFEYETLFIVARSKAKSQVLVFQLRHESD